MRERPQLPADGFECSEEVEAYWERVAQWDKVANWVAKSRFLIPFPAYGGWGGGPFSWGVHGPAGFYVQEDSSEESLSTPAVW